MRKTSILLCLLFIVQICNSQTLPPLNNLPDLIPYNKDGKFGYCNQKQEIKIECKYTDAEPFSRDFFLLNSDDEKSSRFGGSDFATVAIKTEQFRINKSGEIVYTFKPSDFEVERVAEYHEDRMQIFESEKQIGLRQDSTIIIKPMYQEIICFIRYCYSPFIAKLNDKYGVIDLNNKVLIGFKYDKIIDPSYLSDDNLPFIKVKLTNKIFYIDMNGVEYKK